MSKTITIIINGTETNVPKEDFSYDEIVHLAFANPPFGDRTLFTVTYRKGHGNKPQGILAEGESIKVKDGMIFDVTATDKS